MQKGRSEPSAAQVALAQEHTLQRSRLFRQVFDTPGGREVLKVIINELCGYKARLQHISGDAALYQFGRRDVAHAINEIMDFDPSVAESVVVKTKRDGQ